MGFFNSIKQKATVFFMEKIGMKYINSTIRKIIDAAGGILIGFGLTEKAVQNFEEASYEIALGLVALGLSQLWSWVDKYKNQN